MDNRKYHYATFLFRYPLADFLSKIGALWVIGFIPNPTVRILVGGSLIFIAIPAVVTVVFFIYNQTREIPDKLAGILAATYKRKGHVIINEKRRVFSEDGRECFQNISPNDYFSMTLKDNRLTVKNEYKAADKQTKKIIRDTNDTFSLNCRFIHDFEGLNRHIKFHRIGVLFCLLYPILLGIATHVLFLGAMHWGWALAVHILEVLAYFVYLALLFEDDTYYFVRETDWVVDPESIKTRHAVPPPAKQDLNDAEIALRQSRFNQLNQKIDSYMLESGLFGALAFSGFLQIVLNDPSDEKASKIFIPFSHYIQQLTQRFTFDNLVSAFTGDILLTLIALLSLFSTLCFLLVVISRLKFLDILGTMETHIYTAHMYNERENDVSERLGEEHVNIYTRLIDEHLKKFDKTDATMTRIINYTTLVRTLAVYTFFIAVLLSACLLDIRVGMVFAVFSTLSMVSYAIYKSSKSKGITRFYKRNTPNEPEIPQASYSFITKKELDERSKKKKPPTP